MTSSLTAALIAAALSLPLSAPAWAAESYTLDPSHTNITWKANHFGFSSPSGKFAESEGTLVLDEQKPENSIVNVTIKTASIVTGLPKFDTHLKSKDFFDVETYPSATFVSNKVDVIGENRARVQGTLTLHGVAKPAVLDVKLNKIGESPISKKKTAGFTASTIIKRSEFGISYALPGVSDEVAIDIEAEATLQ